MRSLQSGLLNAAERSENPVRAIAVMPWRWPVSCARRPPRCHLSCRTDEEAVATVQLWSRLREDVVADMTRVRNRLQALLLLCDPTYKTRIPDLTTRAGIRACEAYTAPSQSV